MRLLYPAPSRQKIEDEDDDGKDKKDVDESTADVKGKTQEPKNEENDDDCPKHYEKPPKKVSMCCSTQIREVCGSVGRLRSVATGEKVEDQHDDGENEQDVDESAADMHCETQEPKHEENDDDCPKHTVEHS